MVWLTSLDPYGKCLQLVAKLLTFSICHRSAWLPTQKVGALVKAREDEAIAQACDNPAEPVLPAAEVASPDTGVLMADGTCGRIDDEDPQPDESAADDPDAGTKEPDFRKVKLALVGPLVPPTQERKPARSLEPETASAPLDTPTVNCPSKRKRRRKVRPQGEEPSIRHKKLAVHPESPLRLF